MSNASRTYQTRLCQTVDEPLTVYASLMAHVEYHLFADIAAGKKARDLKSPYLTRFNITARQFNSLRVLLEGKIASIQERLTQRIGEKKQRILSLEQAIGRLKNKQVLHRKKRKVHALHYQLKKLENTHQNKKISLCFGSNKLFRSQFHLEANGYSSHAEWKKDWQNARASEIFLLGSKDESAGNQSATATIQPDGSLTLRLRLPDALASQYGKYLLIPNIYFAYGHETICAAIRDSELRRQLTLAQDSSCKNHGQAITIRLKRDSKGWILFATTDLKLPAPITHSRLGVIAVDINSDHLAIIETDRFGNPLHQHTIPLALRDLNKHQIRARIGDAAAQVIHLCKQTQKPLIIEKLDFQKKRAQLKEQGAPYSRMLSSFAYASIISHLQARGQAQGIQVHNVNPAFTSLIGRVKFAKRYGLSTHHAAALCIGRRFLGVSERMPQGRREVPDGKGDHVTLDLPVRNRSRHVWTQWGQLSKIFPAALTAHFRTVKNRSRSSFQNSS
jgi:IS605 OrfB family transposase